MSKKLFDSKNDKNIVKQIDDANLEYEKKNDKINNKYNNYVKLIKNQLDKTLEKKFKKEYRIDLPIKLKIKIPTKCRFSKKYLKQYTIINKSILYDNIWLFFEEEDLEEYIKEYIDIFDKNMYPIRVFDKLKKKYIVKYCVQYMICGFSKIRIRQFYLFTIEN